MRNVIILLLVSILFTSCDQSSSPKKKKEQKHKPTYTIGLNLTLSGNGSYFATEFKKGIDLAMDFINKDNTRQEIKLIYEDNKLNPRDAVSICKKFIEIDKVDAMLVAYTPIAKATIDIMNRAEIPTMVTITSVESIATNLEWVFRDFEMESELMPLLAEYAYADLRLSKGSWLVVNDDMGHDAVRFFDEKFSSSGGTLLDGEVFEASELDLRNKINKIMDGKPEFIIVIGRGSATINACRQIRERDEKIPILGNNTLDNETVWDALGESGNNLWFPRPFTDIESHRYNKANELFIEKFGHEINWLNMFGISIANYLGRALKETDGDKEKLRDYLKTLDVQSIRGRLVMNEESDVLTPHVICKRIDGQTIIVKKQEPQN